MVDERLIHRLVEREAADRPDAVAASVGDVKHSYGELNGRANRLARLLRGHGVVTGSRVAVTVPRSVDFLVAALAVLKAGGAYVPIDPEYPARRQEFMLDDSDAVLVVTAGAGVEGRPSVDMAVVRGGGESDLDIAIEPADLAYLVYTSGSTGVPKGVSISHAAVVDFTRSDPRLAVARDDVIAHLSPTAFDASTFEIWCALTRGAQVAVLGGNDISVAELGLALRTVRPDWMFLTAGLFHLMVDHDVEMFRAVGVVLAGGDVVSPRHARAAAEVVRGKMFNGYGPTETTVFAALHEVDPARPYRRLPLGRALGNKVVRVLDDDLAELPPGVVGEIFIGGASLARGYHRRPGLTAERFLPDPTVPGARIYRTGDRGCLIDDGEVEFVGRSDCQVKIRGFRVELGEIEAVLSAHKSVGAVAVLAVGDDEIGKSLVAYVAPASRTQLSTAELRRCVAGELPAYMVPTRYVLRDALALDPNGKIDRSALPEPWTARADFDLPAITAPNNPSQRMIAEVMADALALDEVGVADNFYELGGDSMRCIQLLELLRELGIVVSVREFLRSPTVAGLEDLASGYELTGGQP